VLLAQLMRLLAACERDKGAPKAYASAMLQVRGVWSPDDVP
jgi:hypothetical protein